jgi:molybdopterin-binding protein
VRVGECLVEVVSDLPAGTPVYLCLRPEDVTLGLAAESESRPRQTSARNRVVGRIRDLAPWKGQIRVGLDCGFALAAAITRRSSVELGLVEGMLVAATFKSTSAHLIPHAGPRPKSSVGAGS